MPLIQFAALFNEELGAVLQVRKQDLNLVNEILNNFRLQDCTHLVGELNQSDQLQIYLKAELYYQESRLQLQQWWAETSYHLQALRDNPDCAKEEFQLLAEPNPGLSAKLNFDPQEDVSAPHLILKQKPRVAILREQGVNGHKEMAAAFQRLDLTALMCI